MSSSSDPSRTRLSAPPMSLPNIPRRRSSLEPRSHTSHKKRLSLTAMPLLSKLGLGRTTSAPTIPSEKDATYMKLGPEQDQGKKIEKPSPLRHGVNADAGDDTKTEVDEDEVLLSDDPSEMEYNMEEKNDLVAPAATSTKTKLSLNIPASVSTPAKPSSSYRRAQPAAGGSVLRELEENEDDIKELSTPKSASSCHVGVWLCSKPQQSTPSSPIDENGNRRRSVGRPLVVRAMSTGRLATEFDEEGRIISLSSHCERVLKARAVITPVPSPVKAGEELRRTVSVADAISPTRKTVVRSQTASIFVSPAAHRRRSVESGFTRLENSEPWQKQHIVAGNVNA